MNRTIYSLIFTFFVFGTIYSQSLDGTYKNGSDSIRFYNNKMYFSLTRNAGLQSKIVGQGRYSLYNDYLIVNTESFNGIKTSITKKKRENKEFSVLMVSNSDDFLEQDVLVEFLSSNGKQIEVSATNEGGLVRIPADGRVAKVKISKMGCNDFVSEIDAKNDFVVKLTKNETIEDKTVILKINHLDEENLSVLILSTDFSFGKNKDKELRKIERKYLNNNILDIRLKKEYIPTYHK